MPIKTDTILNEFKRVETDLLLIALFQKWSKQLIQITFMSYIGLITCFYNFKERRFVALKVDEQIVTL
jgi:hypothetical protein